jgi:hypothetical protein
VPELWSLIHSFFIFFCQSFFFFFSPIFIFFLSVLLSFLLLWNWFLFLSSFVFPLRFRHCFISVSLTHVFSSLTYPNLLGTKSLSCCCCYCFGVFWSDFLSVFHMLLVRFRSGWFCFISVRRRAAAILFFLRCLPGASGSCARRYLVNWIWPWFAFPLVGRESCSCFYEGQDFTFVLVFATSLPDLFLDLNQLCRLKKVRWAACASSYL